MFSNNAFTPEINDIPIQNTNKLVVVIFVVDASRSMEGNKMDSVNEALLNMKSTLLELESDNDIDLRIAVMSFTSSARWDTPLVPIKEWSFNGIQTRAGLTEYGSAFREINKALQKVKFLNRSGKIAAPAIVFLTDGEPVDDYSNDLDELLKNNWFINASRSVILMGDAIENASAKQAVEKFVKDKADLIGVNESERIAQSIELATIHTICGNPTNQSLVRSDPGDIEGFVGPDIQIPMGVYWPFPGEDKYNGGDPFEFDPSEW